jgi:hypothetical protein
MSLSDYVQFFRNLLCCVKDLDAGPRFLFDANVTVHYYEFPEPLNKTTPLEFCISWLQLYPFIFLSKAGVVMMMDAVRTVHRVEKIMYICPKGVSSSPIEKNDEIGQRLVAAKLMKDGKQAIKAMIIGTQLFFIGLAFFWLFANSWHVTETDWVGGIWGLIHALTVMEICLAVLLYYMIVDGREKLRSATAMIELADSLKFKNKMTTPPMNLTTYEFMSKWVPFWLERDGDKKAISEETDLVQRTLQIYRGGKDDGEKEDKIRQSTLEGIVERLRKDAHTTKMEGYRELVLFALNFVAFYGYLMGIVCFYLDEANEPAWMKYFKFFHTHEMADWHGNFAGDLMWTVEPIVMLSSPWVFQMMAPKPKKQKAD